MPHGHVSGFGYKFYSNRSGTCLRPDRRKLDGLRLQVRSTFDTPKKCNSLGAVRPGLGIQPNKVQAPIGPLGSGVELGCGVGVEKRGVVWGWGEGLGGVRWKRNGVGMELELELG